MTSRRRRLMVFSCVLGSFLVAGPRARAEDTGVSYRIHHQYQAPRALGMGDAFVAVANDYTAIFYNPAGLARRTDGEINLDMDFAISNQFNTFAKDIQAAQNTTGTDSDKQNAVMDVISKQYGKAFGTRFQLFDGIWVRPNWGIAILPMDLSTEETLHKTVGPAINTTVYADTTIALAYADDVRNFPGGRFSWGVTGKWINRGYISKSINFMEVATDPNLVRSDDLREGYGFDADLGLLYTPHLPSDGVFSLLRYTRPTFGMVVHNLLENKFKNSLKLFNKNPTDAMQPPEQLYRTIDLGTRWEYPNFWIFSGRGVMDFRDILHPAYSFRKSLHLGFEFDWTVASWWKGAYRFGWSQGYMTAGVSALFTLFNLDLVTYSEDVGTYDTPIENRFYAVRLNFNW